MGATALRSKIGNFIKEMPQLFILIVIAVILAIVNTNFATVSNVINIFKTVSVISILSCGLTLVVVGGALDLSIGSALSFLNLVSAVMQLQSDVRAIWVPLVLAVFLGLFNGLIVTLFNVNSIIVTLGSLSIFAGLALLYVNGAIIIGKAGTWYTFIGQGKVLSIPFHVIIFISVAILYDFLLTRTTFGRALKYVGTNLEAARIAGVRINFVRITAFIISSISAAIAAIILSSRMNSGSPVAGVGFEFDAVTAVVIGGTSLIGGAGSIRKTIIGVLLLAVIINALTLYNVPFAFQNIAKGVLIIIAIIVDVRTREKYGK